jgi:hypothetical protein
MATVTLTAVFTDAAREFSKKFFAPGIASGLNFDAFPAPFTYIDSASALGALAAFPLNTAVSVGQKYAYSADANNQRAYWEVTGAGTSGASQPTVAVPDAYANVAVTSGGATLKYRRFHGWPRARTTIANGIFPTFSVNANSSSQVVGPWTALIASSHVQTLASTLSLSLSFAGSASGNAPGHTLISVNKSVAVPVTMTAGASVLGTGEGKGLTPTSNATKSGLVRGLTLGHDNTTSTVLNYVDRYNWSDDVRFYDCTFQTFRQNNAAVASGGQVDYGHAGGRHAMRCTYKSSHATNPTPALGLVNPNSYMTLLEAPTVTRLTSATTPLVRAADNDGTGTYPPYTADLLVLGANLSTFTGGPVYAAETRGTAVMLQGGTFLTYGSLLKAAAFTTPSVQPISISTTTQNNVIAEEFHAGVSEFGSGYDFSWLTTVKQAAPSLQRNATFTRAGGASDAFGSFSYACQIGERLHYPFTFEFFNAKIDESFQITVEFEWSSTGTGLTALSNEDVWLEAAYLDDAVKNSATLVFSFDKYNRRGLIYNDPIGPSALPSSSATWAGALASAVKQKVSVVVSPKKVGPIKLWFGTWFCPYTFDRKAVSALTLYVDPLPVLTAAP